MGEKSIVCLATSIATARSTKGYPCKRLDGRARDVNIQPRWECTGGREEGKGKECGMGG